MGPLIRLFFQIALLRRGPQDLPASPVLLGLTAMGYFAVTVLVSSVLPPFDGPWFEHLCVDVVFLFAWNYLLLHLAKRPERFLQTATAVYGLQVVLSPFLGLAVWLTTRFEHDSVWQLPATFLSLSMLVWNIAANGHIVKAALELSMLPSVCLVILQTMGSYAVAQQLFPVPNLTS